jgi:hypothetical protein
LHDRGLRHDWRDHRHRLRHARGQAARRRHAAGPEHLLVTRLLPRRLCGVRGHLRLQGDGRRQAARARAAGCELHRIVDQLAAIQIANGFGLRATIKYTDYYGFSITIEDRRNEERDDELLSAADKEITELVKDLARWLYDQLRAEDEYQSSDEASTRASRPTSTCSTRRATAMPTLRFVFAPLFGDPRVRAEARRLGCSASHQGVGLHRPDDGEATRSWSCFTLSRWCRRSRSEEPVRLLGRRVPRARRHADGSSELARGRVGASGAAGSRT